MAINLKPAMPQNKAVRVWIGLAIVALLALSSVLLFWYATRGLFSKNPRFTLRNVVVHSPGWWRDKERNVCELLRIRPGETNLFDLKLASLKKAMEAEPSIEKVTVMKTLPDTLTFDITERIPRAFLYSPKSVWVVDGTGIVMARDTCVNLDGSLPVILGFQTSESLRPGMQLSQLQSAMELINATLTEYRNVRIAAVNLQRLDQLVFVMYYKGNFEDSFRVFMPRKNLKFMMRVLVSTLEHIRSTADPHREINLLYDGNAVLK